MQHDDKRTGGDSDNESTGIKSESGSTRVNDEANQMAPIEEAIAEAEWGIAEGTELLAGTEAETEDTRDKNVIHPDLHVPAEEHTYILRQRDNWQPGYTHIYGFQATIIHYALTQLSMKRGLNKFKQKGEKVVTAEIEQLHRRDSFRPVRTENLS